MVSNSKMNSRRVFSIKIFNFLLLLFLVITFGVSARAADLTSTNFIIHDPIVGTGGGYGSSTNFQVISAGNILGSMGGASSTNFQANYGFLYYQNAIGTITFDIDTASDFSNGESATPYSVPLGTLTTGAVTVSDTSTIKMIVLEGDSSATGGVVVTVQSANGASGLASTSVPTDSIPSSTGTMSAGTANYGLCVATSGLTGFSRSTGYVSDTCALSSGTNAIRALSTTPTSIVNSAGALTGGHAEVVVNAAISTTSPAHTDYADTLTFIMTGTF
jgi:hypothetical protein